MVAVAGGDLDGPLVASGASFEMEQAVVGRPGRSDRHCGRIRRIDQHLGVLGIRIEKAQPIGVVLPVYGVIADLELGRLCDAVRIRDRLDLETGRGLAGWNLQMEGTCVEAPSAGRVPVRPQIDEIGREHLVIGGRGGRRLVEIDAHVEVLGDAVDGACPREGDGDGDDIPFFDLGNRGRDVEIDVEIVLNVQRDGIGLPGRLDVSVDILEKGAWGDQAAMALRRARALVKLDPGAARGIGYEIPHRVAEAILPSSGDVAVRFPGSGVVPETLGHVHRRRAVIECILRLALVEAAHLDPEIGGLRLNRRDLLHGRSPPGPGDLRSDRQTIIMPLGHKHFARA